VNPVQTAAQHLARQGVTFEGRSLFLKRTQELDAQSALQRAQKGRPVDAVIEGQRFPIEAPADLIQLDFFKAKGEGEGLQDRDLARSLRDVHFDGLTVTRPQPDRLPMQAYRILSGQERGQVYAQHSDYCGPLLRDSALALALFSENIGDVSNLAHPERAQSLLHLQEAGRIGLSRSPAEVYITRPDRVYVAAPKNGFIHSLPTDRLENPEQVKDTLSRLTQADQLRQQFLPQSDSLPAQLQEIAWAGNLDMDRCQQIFQHYAAMPEGDQELSRLLHLVQQDHLPTGQTVAHYDELRRSLPNATLRSQEFQWLTSESDKFPQRLQLMVESAPLSAHDKDWHEFGPGPAPRLENNRERQDLVRQLSEAHPLTYETFDLACSLPVEDYARFSDVYRLASPQGLTEKAHSQEFSALWRDAGPSFLDTHEKLIQQGADPGQAVMASAALGDDPSAQMLEMATQLRNPKKVGYSQNPYALALKFAAGLEPDQQTTFAQVFGGRELADWLSTWQQIQVNGKADASLLEVLKTLREKGQPDYQLEMMRLSGASPETLLKNLKEKPEERALRAQRWVAYTARQLSQSQASVSGYAVAREHSYRKQKDDLRELDHWYVPTHEYLTTMDNQHRTNTQNAMYAQELSQTARDWDQRMAQLQSGQIPWGEPPQNQ
jgi:hypothetical protein